MPRTTIFFDVDGVIVDAVKLPQEYVRLMGEVLAPVLVRPDGSGATSAFDAVIPGISALPAAIEAL
jgi:hypothetical protein